MHMRALVKPVAAKSMHQKVLTLYALEGRTAMLISVISVSKCDIISTDFDAKLMQTTFHETEYVFWHS